MCSVIGYYGYASERVAERLARLLDESKIRGLHAFGVAHIPLPCARDLRERDCIPNPRERVASTRPRRASTHTPTDAESANVARASATPASDAIACDRFLTRADAHAYMREIVRSLDDRPLALIAHCRYSTSGDWREPSNNQPIVLDGVALAFNGVIRMTTNVQWGEEFGFKPQTDNDGEIFVRKVLDGENWVHWVASGSFSFAGVMLYRGDLIALRNRHRPLHYHYEGHGTYVASTADIFRRAGFHGSKEFTAGEVYHVGKLS